MNASSYLMSQKKKVYLKNNSNKEGILIIEVIHKISKELGYDPSLEYMEV